VIAAGTELVGGFLPSLLTATSVSPSMRTTFTVVSSRTPFLPPLRRPSMRLTKLVSPGVSRSMITALLSAFAAALAFSRISSTRLAISLSSAILGADYFDGDNAKREPLTASLI